MPPADGIDLPPELQPQVDLFVSGRLPSFVDQVFAYATQEELGLDVTPADDVIAITRGIPFWPSIRLLARFQRDLWNVRVDQDGQIELLNRWYAGSEFATRASAWIRANAQRVLFSEQQLFALQRLVILNSYDGPVEDAHRNDEYLGLLFALVAVPGSILGAEVPTSEAIDDEEWVRLFVGHGGFIGRGALRNEIGRAYRLYSEIAESEDALRHVDYCPIDDWLIEEYGLTFEELEGIGFALHAGSKMLDSDEPPTLIDETYFAPTKLAAKARAGLDALSAEREWFVERFARTQSDPRRAAFEITPFLQRPALRQPDGKVMPLAPRALEAWLGATGNYYRLFDIARARGSSTRKSFTRFNGAIVERYAAETMERAFPPRDTGGLLWLPGNVYRDRTYQTRQGERRTPDVCIDLTPDLIVIEVTGSRLTERSVVDADPDSVRTDIQKLLVEKIEQAGERIRDLQSSLAMLPGLRMAEIHRIWPIVVSGEGILQTPTLWSYLRPAIENALSWPKIQPLTMFDLEDLEEFAGLIAEGYSGVTILEEKTTAMWHEMEFAAWFRADGVRRYSETSRIAREQFDAAAGALIRIIGARGH
jgi:hypothetical protein